MMLRKVSCLMLSAIFIILTMTNIVYAQPTTIEKVHYGSKVENLKGKEETVENLQEIKRLRANTNIVYEQPTTIEKVHYGPKVEDLKGKEDIIKNLQEMKRLRANLTIINITENLTDQELKSINKDLNYYLEQFNIIRKNLEAHKFSYKDSFADLFFAEEISFVADSFIISIRQQQNLIIALESNKEEAKKLFYSNYLIPVYYYLTLGDQMIAYIETYFVLS